MPTSKWGGLSAVSRQFTAARAASAAGPAIEIDATDVHIGRIEIGENIVCRYNVRNAGKESLNLSANPG